MNRPGRLGLRTGFRALARHGSAAARARPAALQPGDVHAAGEFDVLGFTLQYDLGHTNVLTMLDLGRHSAALPRSGRSSIRW